MQMDNHCWYFGRWVFKFNRMTIIVNAFGPKGQRVQEVKVGCELLEAPQELLSQVSGVSYTFR